MARQPRSRILRWQFCLVFMMALIVACRGSNNIMYTQPPPEPDMPTHSLDYTAQSTGIAYVRVGPFENCPSIGQLRPGERIRVDGSNAAGNWWYICCVDDNPGWVFSSLLLPSTLVNLPLITSVPPSCGPGKIIYASDASGYAHIFVVDGDGKDSKSITAGNQYFWNPIWSFDGSRQAFVSKTGDNTDIFVANGDGGNRRPLTNHPAADDHPSWFPNNSELAFASNRSGAWQIYRMNADGTEQRQLTFTGTDNRFVDVSPDGTRLAYAAIGGQFPIIDVVVMNSDGTWPRIILSYRSRLQREDVGRYVFRPDWSPDGVHVAFGADDNDDGLISILKLNVDTLDIERLIEDGNSPAWSPDGGKVVYKPSGDVQTLQVADSTGAYLYRLTNSSYNSWSPDWAP